MFTSLRNAEERTEAMAISSVFTAVEALIRATPT
jgi:hypothetical protein